MEGGPRLATQPLHVQLRKLLVQRIVEGTWRPGDVIPNENELAREFNLSPGTVRKALDWMEQAHIVVRQQGRGTFVTDPASPELASRFDRLRQQDGSKLELQTENTTLETAAPSRDEAERLQLPRGAMVLRVRQTRRVTNGPVALVEEASLPASLFASFTGSIEGSYDIVQMSKQCMVLLGDGIESISMVPPPEAIAALFEMRSATPVLVLERLIYTVEGVPAEYRKAWCGLDNIVYRSNID